MNHDATHCADYTTACPKSCYRAELTADLRKRTDLLWLPMSFAHFKGKKECPKYPKPPKGETIYCKNCENLMFSDCYGECAKGYKGVVYPDDTCEHGVRRKSEGDNGK